MHIGRAAGFVVALAVAAGCLQAGPAGLGPAAGDADATFGGETNKTRLPVPDFRFESAIDADHGGNPAGHSIPQLHQGSHGLELVAYHPLTRPADGVGTPDVGYTGIDVWSTYVCVTQWPGPGGFMILDIDDPADPRVIAREDSGMANQICRFTDDGEYLLLGAYIGARNDGVGSEAPAPAGDAGTVGLRVYDVREKDRPVFLYQDMQGADQQSTHGLYTAKINGTNYAFYSYSGHVFAVERDGLRLVSRMEKSFHDVWAGPHPLTGEWVAIQGNGCNLVVYNIDDPAAPVELDEWDAREESSYEDACADHWRRPLAETVDGRAYMVVVGAKFDGEPLPFTVLDFTDPTEIFEVSRWVIPGEPHSPPPNFYTFGGTEYETWNGYVAAGIMHAGLWVFDIGSSDRAQEPVTIGYAQAVETPWTNGGTINKPAPYAPMMWTAAFDERGYVLAPDTGTGLYIYRFGATQDGP